MELFDKSVSFDETVLESIRSFGTFFLQMLYTGLRRVEIGELLGQSATFGECSVNRNFADLTYRLLCRYCPG